MASRFAWIISERDSVVGMKGPPHCSDDRAPEEWRWLALKRKKKSALIMKRGQLGPGPTIGMTHSQMLGKFEYTRGPIFKVVLEC